MDLLLSAGRAFEDVVAALPDTAWENDTPCDLSVRDVVDHVVAGNVFTAELLRGVPRAEASTVLSGDHLGDDPVAAVAASCERQHAAFAAVDPGFRVPFPGGDLPLETFLRFRVGDLVVHGWDVARGAGLDETIPAGLVDGLWEMVAPHLDEMRSMGAFGDGASRDLPTDAPAQVRLLDAFGRRP